MRCKMFLYKYIRGIEMDALDFFHFVLLSFVNKPFRSFFQSFKQMTLFILKIIHFESFSFVFSVYHYWEKSLERLVKSFFKQFISLFFFVCFENDCFFITLNDSFFSWTTPSFTKNFVFSQKKFVHNNEAHLYKEDRGGGICFLLF